MANTTYDVVKYLRTQLMTDSHQVWKTGVYTNPNIYMLCYFPILLVFMTWCKSECFTSLEIQLRTAGLFSTSDGNFLSCCYHLKKRIPYTIVLICKSFDWPTYLWTNVWEPPCIVSSSTMYTIHYSNIGSWYQH